jgi:small-conductance mechanosensitive channel
MEMPSLSPAFGLPPAVFASTTDTTEPSSEPTGAPADLGDGVPDTVQDTVQDGATNAVESLGPFWGMLTTVAIAVAIALAVVVAVWLLLNVVLRTRPALRQQIGRCRVPVAVALSILSIRIALGLTASEYEWFEGVSFVLLAGIIGSLAWLALRIVRIVEERLLDKYASDDVDDRRDRKIRTQTVLLRRVLNAVIIVIAVSVILLTIPSVRAVGAGLLASAGVLSVVAGLAVQSTLTNVFAGVQLAFTDAIRVGDVVTVGDVFGNIEDITLSYVVVKIWDGRRVIFPSSHFTTTPFENWTRTGSALSGTVEMEVDWRVPMDATRERLKDLLESTELWDGKESSIQITDALGGMVKIRAVVSARNSGDLWDLRCLVREDMVSFLRSEHPEAIYAQRLAEGSDGASPLLEAVGIDFDDDGQPKTGGAAAEGRAQGQAPAHTPRTPTSPLPQVGPGTGQQPASPSQPGTHQQPATGPQGIPTGSTPAQTGSTPLTKASGDSSVFTGSITAVERNREFAGPGEKAYQERKDKAAQADGAGDEADEDTPKRHGPDSDLDGPETGE